jgi:hypothetical protein
VNRIVVVAFLFAAACAKPATPEEQVRAALGDAARALEKGDVGAAGDALSDDYADGARRTKQQMKGLALFALRRGPVAIVLQDVVVRVDGDRATATTKAFAVQGAAEVQTPRDLLPQRAREFPLTTTWAREGGAWRITAIDGDGARAE